MTDGMSDDGTKLTVRSRNYSLLLPCNLQQDQDVELGTPTGVIDWAGAEDALPQRSGMNSVFTTIKRGCGITAAIATGCYIIALTMALSDGQGQGVEIPRPLDVLTIMLIVCSTVLAGAARIAELASRISAEQYIRPIVRYELDRAFAENLPLLVATVIDAADQRAARVAGQVGERLDGALHDIAALAAKQTAARLREAQTADLTEICTDLHRKTLVAGMQLQANASGEQIGKNALRSVKTYMPTSQGD